MLVYQTFGQSGDGIGIDRRRIENEDKTVFRVLNHVADRVT